MHQSECDIAFYNLCTADPLNPINGVRARRFAGFYLNEDPEAINWDPELRIVFNGHHGSRGPHYRPLSERENANYSPLGGSMERYSLPFFDLPGIESVEDLADPAKAKAMGQALFDRWYKGGHADQPVADLADDQRLPADRRGEVPRLGGRVHRRPGTSAPATTAACCPTRSATAARSGNTSTASGTAAPWAGPSRTAS